MNHLSGSFPACMSDRVEMTSVCVDNNGLAGSISEAVLPMGLMHMQVFGDGLHTVSESTVSNTVLGDQVRKRGSFGKGVFQKSPNRKFRDFGDSRDPPSEKIPFAMTPFSGPEVSFCFPRRVLGKELGKFLSSHCKANLPSFSQYSPSLPQTQRAPSSETVPPPRFSIITSIF